MDFKDSMRGEIIESQKNTIWDIEMNDEWHEFINSIKTSQNMIFYIPWSLKNRHTSNYFTVLCDWKKITNYPTTYKKYRHQQMSHKNHIKPSTWKQLKDGEKLNQFQNKLESEFFLRWINHFALESDACIRKTW